MNTPINPIDFEKLNKAFDDRSMNVTALAAKIGHDRVVVSGWKNGRRTPTLYSALKLARGLGVTVEELCLNEEALAMLENSEGEAA